MDAIDVRDFAEPVARAIESMVSTLREQYKVAPKREAGKKRHRELPVWPGTVIGCLTRDEIYEDVR